MTIIVYLLLILGGAGLFIQRSKALTIIIFFFVWTMMWCTKTADFAAYKSIYIENEFRDGGYSILCMIGRNLGLSFFQFYLTLGAIGYTIYCRFVLRYAERCSFVAALYMLFISFFDIVQYRNFIAFSIVLCALPRIFTGKQRDTILYCVAVILASFIHITMLFYIGFPFLNRDVFKLENFKNYLIPLLLLIAGMYFGVAMFEERMTTISGNYSGGVSTITKFVILFIFIGNAVFIGLWNNTPASPSLNHRQEVLTCNAKQQVLFFNIALILLYPIAIQSTTIFRLYKYVALINFAYLSNKFVSSKNLKIIPQTLITVLYAASYLALFIYNHLIQFLPTVFLPIIRRNLFWTFISS